MNAWVNIDASPDDQEILAVNRLESSLGDMPKQVYKVRELITRFEVCHFKYQRHYEYIIKSIELEYQVEATDICNYAFPQNLDRLIQAIGRLTPLQAFDGCGTFNAEIWLAAEDAH